MARAFKLLFLAVLAAAGFAAYSYLGARFTAGRLLGPNPPLSGRTIRFEFHGVQEVAGRPRAWVFSYSRSQLPGVRRATLVISFNGRLLATQPRDLPARLQAWEQSRLP